MARYRSPFNLPDQHMRLVGIIAAHWESIDVILQRGIADAMDVPLPDIRLLTENLSVAAKIDLITAKAREILPKDQFKDFNKVIGLVQAAYGQRNAFVHAKWSENGAKPKEPWRISVRTKGGRISIVQKPTPVGELVAAATAIFSAGDELTNLFLRHGMLQS